MKYAGQPKSCLFFAGLRSPVAIDHSGSFDKIWVEDSVHERQIQGVSTCPMSLELREWWVCGTSWRIWYHADLASQSPLNRSPQWTLWHTQLWVGSLDVTEIAARIGSTCFISFFRTSIWKSFRGTLENQMGMLGALAVWDAFSSDCWNQIHMTKEQQCFTVTGFVNAGVSEIQCLSPAGCGLTLRWTFEF